MAELDLIFEGTFLKDLYHISACNIGKNPTLHTTFLLRGGVIGRGASPSSKPSFKDVIDKRTNRALPEGTKPAEYMVEKSKQSPSFEMADPTIEGIFVAYSAREIICIFNGLSPKIEQLYQWVHFIWAIEVEISLCANNFFIVYFIYPTYY